MANQIFCFQIKCTLWMAQFFPDCLYACVPSAQPSRNFQRPQIALALRARAILLVFEKIYLCLLIPICTRNHVITYINFYVSLLHSITQCHSLFENETIKFYCRQCQYCTELRGILVRKRVSLRKKGNKPRVFSIDQGINKAQLHINKHRF